MSFPHSPSPGPGRPPKVPIPRLEPRPSDKPPPVINRSRNTPRATRACVACRRRKIRCLGGQPRCQNCLDSDEQCVYVQTRKDRLKTATERNQDMIAFLQDLRASVSADRQQQIDDLLGDVMDDVSDAVAALSTRTPDPDDVQREEDASAGVGSNEELDVLDEDVLQDDERRATGFIGKSSQLQWLRRLQKQVEYPEGLRMGFEGPHGPPGDSKEASSRRIEAQKKRFEQHSAPVHTSTLSFYLDNDNADIDYTVNPFQLPPVQTAQRLFDSYMGTVQDAFPILSRTSFTESFYRYYTSITQGTPHGETDQWLALLNLVFAIGAKYSHLVEADWQADQKDHVVYQSRAHILGLNGPALVSTPDLTQLQVTALLALYLLTVGRVNRAWVVIGIALRFAHALGLHMRNDDRTASVTRKEMLLHIWWGLYCLEGHLCTVVGRPSFVIEDYCSAPLPLPLATEQLSDETLAKSYKQYSSASLHQSSFETNYAKSELSNAGSFLKSRVQITAITQRAMTKLYSARIVVRPWKYIQETIPLLCDELEVWSTSLPSGLNFAKPNAGAEFQRERLILNMHYIGTKILITRPCLCRLDGRIPNQTSASDAFNNNTARMCVDAAKAMTDLLTDHVDAIRLYQTGPWWCLVHNCMQALIVLLLEMSYGTVHFLEHGQEILPYTKKLIRWLRRMKRNNKIAERAYNMAFRMLQGLAPRINADISDLLSEDAAASAEASTSPPFQAHATSWYYDQGHASSAGPVNQQNRGQDVRTGASYGFPTSHPSLFPFPPEQPQQMPWLTSFTDPTQTSLANLQHSTPAFDSSFHTAYDEHDPFAFNLDYLNTDTNMSDVPHEDPSA